MKSNHALLRLPPPDAMMGVVREYVCFVYAVWCLRPWVGFDLEAAGYNLRLLRSRRQRREGRFNRRWFCVLQ
jgi:hypothetical protein